jgi:hypothetical protein
MYEKTERDWAVPAFLSGLFLIALVYVSMANGPQIWQLVLVLAWLVLLLVAGANFWRYIQEHQTGELTERQRAMAVTADSRVFEEARYLAAQSPELAGELAKRFGRPDLILLPHRQGKRAQIKLAGSEVTFEFVMDALNKSDEKYFVALRNYTEGTYHYDGNKEISDRQQWKQLNWIFARDGLCTRYVEGQPTNTPPMWLPPWTPAQVRENWLFPVYLVDLLRPWVITDDENKAE